MRATATILAATAFLLSSCTSPTPLDTTSAPSTSAAAGEPAETSSAATTPSTSAGPPSPAWQVGATPLPLRRDGFGQILPTPPVLANRSLPTTDLLPPPAGNRFAGTVNPVPAEVLARSTWQPGCPVAAGELRYLTLSFWGFDGHAHTGEILVNASVADAVVTVFGQLFAAKFPIEEMRVTAPAELTAPPTGDGNNTNAFVCRPARGQTNWSAHAYGLAIDVDPFCNPYTKGDLVLPELASAYLDRGNPRPGMITPGDRTVAAFSAIGWTWGGTWTTPKDRMHFSSNGR